MTKLSKITDLAKELCKLKEDNDYDDAIEFHLSRHIIEMASLIEEMKAALEFYANQDYYIDDIEPVDFDLGKKAHDCLKSVSKRIDI